MMRDRGRTVFSRIARCHLSTSVSHHGLAATEAGVHMLERMPAQNEVCEYVRMRHPVPPFEHEGATFVVKPSRLETLLGVQSIIDQIEQELHMSLELMRTSHDSKTHPPCITVSHPR